VIYRARLWRAYKCRWLAMSAALVYHALRQRQRRGDGFPTNVYGMEFRDTGLTLRRERAKLMAMSIIRTMPWFGCGRKGYWNKIDSNERSIAEEVIHYKSALLKLVAFGKFSFIRYFLKNLDSTHFQAIFSNIKQQFKK